MKRWRAPDRFIRRHNPYRRPSYGLSNVREASDMESMVNNGQQDGPAVGVVPQDSDQDDCLFPFDMVSEIMKGYLDITDVKETEGHPLKNMTLVCQHWNQASKTDQFRSMCLEHPVYSLLHLSRTYVLGSDFRRKMFLTATRVMDRDSLIQFILNSTEVEDFKVFMNHPVFSGSELPRDVLQATFKKAYKKGILPSKLTPCDEDEVEEFQGDPRKWLRRKASSLDRRRRFTLHEMKIVEVLKVLFLEDWFNTENFTWAFSFVLKQILRACRRNEVDLLQNLFMGIRALGLPRYSGNLLYLLVEYPLFLAAYIGDRSMLEAFKVDFDLVVKHAKNDPAEKDTIECVSIYKSIVSGDLERFPDDKLGLAMDIMERRGNYFAFRNGQLRTRSLEVLANPQVPVTVKDMLRDLYVDENN